MISLINECPFCGKESYVTVFADDFEAWQAGGLVQDCFPYLSADEREILVSGICPTCWEQMFGAED